MVKVNVGTFDERELRAMAARGEALPHSNIPEVINRIGGEVIQETDTSLKLRLSKKTLKSEYNFSILLIGIGVLLYATAYYMYYFQLDPDKTPANFILYSQAICGGVSLLGMLYIVRCIWLHYGFISFPNYISIYKRGWFRSGRKIKKSRIKFLKYGAYPEAVMVDTAGG